MAKSLIQNGRYCYVCGTDNALHKHHIFYGSANRKLAEEDGAFCYLCYLHHNGSNVGVHFNKDLDLELKRKCQLEWLRHYDKPISAFIERYGRTWL